MELQDQGSLRCCQWSMRESASALQLHSQRSNCPTRWESTSTQRLSGMTGLLTDLVGGSLPHWTIGTWQFEFECRYHRTCCKMTRPSAATRIRWCLNMADCCPGLESGNQCCCRLDS